MWAFIWGKMQLDFLRSINDFITYDEILDNLTRFMYTFDGITHLIILRLKYLVILLCFNISCNLFLLKTAGEGQPQTTSPDELQQLVSRVTKKNLELLKIVSKNSNKNILI